MLKVRTKITKEQAENIEYLEKEIIEGLKSDYWDEDERPDYYTKKRTFTIARNRAMIGKISERYFGFYCRINDEPYTVDHYRAYKAGRIKGVIDETYGVYIIGSFHWCTKELDAVKIGITNDINKRIGEMQTCTPNKLRKLRYWRGMTESQARATEKKLQRMLIYQHILNEWYRPVVYEEIKHILEKGG